MNNNWFELTTTYLNEQHIFWMNKTWIHRYSAKWGKQIIHAVDFFCDQKLRTGQKYLFDLFILREIMWNFRDDEYTSMLSDMLHKNVSKVSSFCLKHAVLIAPPLCLKRHA